MRKLGILLAVVLFGLMVFAESNTVGTKADLEKVCLLEASVTELYDSIDGLNEILTGLAAQIGDTDYLLRKQIENLSKDVNAKLEELTKASDEKLSQIDTLMNRIELLEEYVNMIYEMVGTKVSTEDFETFNSELDERISTIETDLLNVKNTVDTGLPALRDMLYELSDNLAALEERLTSYIEVSINSLKEEMVKEGITTEAPNNDFETALEDIKVTLDIHDNDILKIYETLGTLSDQIAALEEKIIDPEAIETLTLKVDMHDQDIVNIYDNLSQKADREQVDQIETALENYATREEVTKMLSDSEKKFDEKLNNVNTIAWFGIILGVVAVVFSIAK